MSEQALDTFRRHVECRWEFGNRDFSKSAASKSQVVDAFSLSALLRLGSMTDAVFLAMGVPDDLDVGDRDQAFEHHGLERWQKSLDLLS